MAMSKLKYFKNLFLMVFVTLVCADCGAVKAETVFTCENAKKVKNGQEIIKKTQSSYKKVLGLAADFEQSSVLLGMADAFQSTGTLKFMRQGRMNWEYLTPKPQKFISDGETVWFYEPEVNQVTIGKLTKSFDSQVPVSFLLGVGDIEKSFSATEACKIQEGYLLKLKPKEPQPNLKEFSLLVDSVEYLPIGAKIVDSGDTSTQFVFKNLKQVESFNSDQFRFVPPDGVDVVRH